MNTLLNFALHEKFKEISKRKPGLQNVHDLIDWTTLTASLPDRTPTNAGRHPIPHIIMIKVLCLQAWHNLSDEEMEYQCYNRFDFQKFLNYSHIPDARTIWSYREWLQEEDLLDSFWATLQSEFSKNNIQLKEGKIQDATFVHADPGKAHSGMDGRGREAKTSRQKDATWTKKGNKSIFGYKAHFKMDTKTKLITEIAVTTAKTFDGHIDLADPTDIIARDRGYSNSKTRAKGDATMKKGNLSPREKLRNKRIAKYRSRGEHPLGTINRMFKGGRTKLTTTGRVFVQQIFQFAVYNMHRLAFLTRQPSVS